MTRSSDTLFNYNYNSSQNDEKSQTQLKKNKKCRFCCCSQKHLNQHSQQYVNVFHIQSINDLYIITQHSSMQYQSVRK